MKARGQEPAWLKAAKIEDRVRPASIPEASIKLQVWTTVLCSAAVLAYLLHYSFMAPKMTPRKHVKIWVNSRYFWPFLDLFMPSPKLFV